MAVRLWTSLLALLAGGFVSAWLVALMHEKDIRPVRELAGFFRKLPRSGRIIVGALFVALWIVAGTKPGGGITPPHQSHAGILPRLHTIISTGSLSCS